MVQARLKQFSCLPHQPSLNAVSDLRGIGLGRDTNTQHIGVSDDELGTALRRIDAQLNWFAKVGKLGPIVPRHPGVFKLMVSLLGFRQFAQNPTAFLLQRGFHLFE